MRVHIFTCLLLLNFRLVFTTNDFNSDDFSWFTEKDHIVSPDQMHLSNEPSSPKAQHESQMSGKIKMNRGTKRRRSPEYYKAVLGRTEGELKKANEKLEEARKTGKGSLREPKKFVEKEKAIKQRLKRNERLKKGGKEYEEYLEARRNRQREKRLAYTPEQKKAYQAKQREKEQKKREWLKLPGNEAELEARRLKNRASLSRHFAKTKRVK